MLSEFHILPRISCASLRAVCPAGCYIPLHRDQLRHPNLIPLLGLSMNSHPHHSSMTDLRLPCGKDPGR